MSSLKIVKKNVSKSLRENGILMTPFAISGKNAQCSNATRMYSYKEKRKQKAPKDVQFSGL